MSNRRFFLLSLAVMMVLVLLPYGLGRAMTRHGSLFYGNRTVSVADNSIYYSYINQGRHGQLFMYDAFTSEQHQATLFQPVWFGLGIIARIFSLNAPDAFMLGRIVTMPVLIFTLWWAARWFWPGDRLRQRLGFILSLTASGVGGIGLALSTQNLSHAVWYFPDLWVTEAYTMLTLGGSPHFILVTAGIVFVLVATERSWIERRWSWTLWAGLVALITLSIHPFHIVTWGLVWFGLTIWRSIVARRIMWSYIVRWLVVISMASPILLLYWLQLRFDPLTIGRAVQNSNLSLPLWLMALGLGFPLMAAIVGVWRWRPRDERWKFVVVLATAYFVAIYLPLLFQRRLSQGLVLPIAWLAVPVVAALYTTMQRRFRYAVVIVSTGVFFILTSSWIIISGLQVRDYAADLTVPLHMYYVSPSYQHLARYLATTNVHQPVLSTLLEGNVLGGLSAHQMFLGYGVETLQFTLKWGLTKSFYGHMSLEEQRQVLSRYHLCYVIESYRTQQYGDAFQPTHWPDLTRVWSEGDISLYRTPYCQ